MSQFSSRTTVAEQDVRPGTLFAMAVWFALVGGLAEATAQVARFSVLGEITNRSRHLWWMSPASYLLFMIVAAIVLGGSGRVIRALRSIDVAAAVMTFLAVFSLAIGVFHPRIGVIPLAIVAAGSATVVRRTVRTRTPGFTSRVMRSLPWLIVATGVAAGGAAYRMARRPAMAPLPANAIAGQRPNILLLIWDTVRRANVSLYGYRRETTPELTRMAADGFTFERAFSPSPWTLPAHASMFTGRLPDELSADWNVALDDTHSTVAELLAGAGYATAGFVANRDYGTFQHGLNRGFQHYEDYAVSFGEVVLSSGLLQWIVENQQLRTLVGTDDLVAFKRAETVVDDFLDWFDGSDGGEFFAFLNLFDAHDPYLPPDEWYRKFGVTRPNRLSYLRRIGHDHRPTAAELEDEMAAYDGALAYMDAQLGRLRRELEARGILDETIIIVASDHGEEFGEHQLVFHGHSLYATQLWVPMVIVVPNAVGPRRIAPPATLRDIASTILDFADVEAPPGVHGTSLARFWEDPDPAVDDIIDGQLRQLPPGGHGLPAAEGDMRSTLRWPIHTIFNPGGGVEIYDLQVDPFALQDVRARMFRPRRR